MNVRLEGKHGLLFSQFSNKPHLTHNGYFVVGYMDLFFLFRFIVPVSEFISNKGCDGHRKDYLVKSFLSRHQ